LGPWDEWEVQKDFLQRLNEWNRAHSQSTLDGTMKKIQGRLSKIGTVLDSQVVKEILEFIPNDPFPAGHLVKCLLGVVIVGVVIISQSQSIREADTWKLVENIRDETEGIRFCDRGRGRY
jgi:hypothetical protein